jgi:rubrerythrin
MEATMTTSKAWWAKTQGDSAALRGWLRDQFRGEATAAARIDLLRDAFTTPRSRAYRILSVIAAQERRHAQWVGELLAARGEPLTIDAKADRYWPRVLHGIDDLETGAAIGAHAERMRLERIETIANDEGAADDIRRVFAKILPEERFHERAFRSLAGVDAMERTAGAHELGRRALGLF